MYDLIKGDAYVRLQDLDADSVHSLICDPPAGIAFMGKAWDHDKGGASHWIAWLTGIMKEAHRVMKPGAYGFVWALPRTSHWTATALEDAGFDVRDVVMHVFGSGFPKSHNISKGIDKAAGFKKDGIGKRVITLDKGGQSNGGSKFRSDHAEYKKPACETDQAKQWDGWGTALKPAAEHWILIRKPLSEKTVAKNVLKHGVGGINVDGCRVETSKLDADKTRRKAKEKYNNHDKNTAFKLGGSPNIDQGRFPSNFICSGDARDMLDEQSGVLLPQGNKRGKVMDTEGKGSMFGGGRVDDSNNYKDTGGASRFFYCAKASKSERNAGCEGMEEKDAPTSTGATRPGAPARLGANPDGRSFKQNHHPTVKAQKLMRYLARMITPPGGTVLDPFTGSGSTGVAAVAEGFNFIGIEQEQEYLDIAKARIDHTVNTLTSI